METKLTTKQVVRLSDSICRWRDRVFFVDVAEHERFETFVSYAIRVGKTVSQCADCDQLIITKEPVTYCERCDRVTRSSGGVPGRRRFTAEQHDADYHGGVNGGEW